MTAAMVKELREKTGAPMMDCKNALEASGGEIEPAREWLRKKGMATAAKKEARKSADGLVRVEVQRISDIIDPTDSSLLFPMGVAVCPLINFVLNRW